MQISPNATIVIKIVLLLCTAIVSGTLSFTGIFPTQVVTYIVAGSSSMIVVIGIILTAFSSSKPGPLAPDDPLVVQAATAVANLPKGAAPAIVEATKTAAVNAITAHTNT